MPVLCLMRGRPRIGCLSPVHLRLPAVLLLVAVVGYFRRDVTTYVVEGTKLVFARKVPPTADGKLAWLFVLATLPAAAVGALFEDQIDSRLGTPTLIAISLIGFGILLAIADHTTGRREVGEFRARDAVLVGVAQAPGRGSR